MKNIDITTDVMADKIHIKEFNLDSMCKNPSILYIGKRGCGKSWSVLNLLYKFSKDDNTSEFIIIAPTEKQNPFYSTFDLGKKTTIEYKYDETIFEKILATQRYDRINTVQKNIVIVLDDCLASKGKWLKNEILKEILFNGRHHNITLIWTMQFPLGITPELRSNFDYIFLTSEDYISNLKRLYGHYAGMFPTFESFRQVFSQLTENFGMMVIANRGARVNFFEKIFWHKAQDLRDIIPRVLPPVLPNFDFNEYILNKKALKVNILPCDNDSDTDIEKLFIVNENSINSRIKKYTQKKNKIAKSINVPTNKTNLSSNKNKGEIKISVKANIDIDITINFNS